MRCFLFLAEKTHQSQGQVTFLKTVPLFLQGYTYYLKRVMTPTLVPASNLFPFSLLAFEILPHEPHHFASGYNQQTGRKDCHNDISRDPVMVSETTGKAGVHSHKAKQACPQIKWPPLPSI